MSNNIQSPYDTITNMGDVAVMPLGQTANSDNANLLNSYAQNQAIQYAEIIPGEIVTTVASGLTTYTLTLDYTDATRSTPPDLLSFVQVTEGVNPVFSTVLPYFSIDLGLGLILEQISIQAFLTNFTITVDLLTPVDSTLNFLIYIIQQNNLI